MEIQEIIENALDTLNQEEKEIFRLKVYSKMRCAEIAKRLNKPLGTIVSKLSRTYQKLQDLIEPFLE